MLYGFVTPTTVYGFTGGRRRFVVVVVVVVVVLRHPYKNVMSIIKYWIAYNVGIELAIICINFIGFPSGMTIFPSGIIYGLFKIKN